MQRPTELEIADGQRHVPSHPKVFFPVVVQPTAQGYRGCFTSVAIPTDAVVFVDGGMVIQNLERLPKDLYGHQNLIAPELYLSPQDYDAMEPIWFLNHHCAANLKRVGGLVYVARRPIEAGEELTIDYAAFVAGVEVPWSMPCLCAAPSCRGTVTADDWRNPRLARQLWPELLPFVQQKVLEAAAP